MKIRIRGNSVRLRLTKTEVEILSKEGSHTEEINFPGSVLSYCISTKEDIVSMETSYKDNTITVYIPMKDALEWPTNAKIGFQNAMKTSKENSISILVEKDFVCMDETVEDQTDNYPNPKAI